MYTKKSVQVRRKTDGKKKFWRMAYFGLRMTLAHTQKRPVGKLMRNSTSSSARDA